MIVVVDSVQNGILRCQLYSLHTVYVAQSPLSFSAKEGDFLQWKNKQWNLLPQAKKTRLSHTNKQMQDLFI